MQDILSLPGPDFLNVFGAVVMVVLAATFLVIRFADHTGGRPPPLAPQNPDAIEIAYLQGGVNQVIRTLVYDLVQRGYAKLGAEDRIIPTEKYPAPGELNAMERRVLDSIQAKPKAHELFQNRTQRNMLMELLAPVRAKLDAEELVKPASVKAWRTRAQIVGSLVILGLSGAKIYVAHVHGRSNVAYLIFLTIAAMAALFALAYVMTRTHASRRGRAWLESMRLAYQGRLDDNLQNVGAPTASRAFEGASLFLISLYGFSALKGTQEEAFYNTFKRGSSSDVSSCGSSCSGSCGSGDGGGGGCGGCGGGD